MFLFALKGEAIGVTKPNFKQFSAPEIYPWWPSNQIKFKERHNLFTLPINNSLDSQHFASQMDSRVQLTHHKRWISQHSSKSQIGFLCDLFCSLFYPRNRARRYRIPNWTEFQYWMIDNFLTTNLACLLSFIHALISRHRSVFNQSPLHQIQLWSWTTLSTCRIRGLHCPTWCRSERPEHH